MRIRLKKGKRKEQEEGQRRSDTYLDLPAGLPNLTFTGNIEQAGTTHTAFLFQAEKGVGGKKVVLLQVAVTCGDAHDNFLTLKRSEVLTRKKESQGKGIKIRES